MSSARKIARNQQRKKFGNKGMRIANGNLKPQEIMNMLKGIEHKKSIGEELNQLEVSLLEAIQEMEE